MKTIRTGLAILLAGLAVFLPGTVGGQSNADQAETNGFSNLNFEEGAPGTTPPGWRVSKALAAQGFSAVLVTNQPALGRQCVEIRWSTNSTVPPNLFANLMQSVDARPFRGKRIKVTAAMRDNATEAGGRAQMWLRVNAPRGVTAFDNMDDRPVKKTGWADYSITLEVASDAEQVTLGMMALDGATAWWDNVRIEELDTVATPELEALAGNWKGALEIGPISLRVFFVFEAENPRRVLGYFVSPDQSAMKLPLTRTEVTSNNVEFGVASIGGNFTGQINGETREIKGEWKQGGKTFPLNLVFTEESWKQRRPQTPRPPFPYVSEEVVFENQPAGVKLAGTLTKPAAAGPFPAVICITGSGPQDRDETLFGHKPFAVIADDLTRHGFAVLRFDDRGFGKSTGDFKSATSEDFSRDAEAALDFLKQRPEIGPKRIGFLGHSEGGMIAPMIAARRNDVAFLVLLAAPGVSGEEIAIAQAESFSRLKGYSEDFIVKSRPLTREMVQWLRSNPTAEEVRAKTREMEARTIPLMEESDRKLYERSKSEREASMEIGLAQLHSAWMQFLLRYDPAGDLVRVKCPVLALNGELDQQVLASQNLPAIATGIRAGGNTRVTTQELKGLNHLFQPAKTGALKEYGEIEETFSPAALDAIQSWLQQNTL